MAKVVILYNEPTLAADHPDAVSEHEIVYTVDETEKVLVANGHTVSRIGVHVDPGIMVAGLHKRRPEVVFNLHEGLPAMGETEAFAAGLLEWLGYPYTGCPFRCIVLCQDKTLTKRILRSAGLPTPRCQLLDTPPRRPNRLGYPVIVKPSRQDASVGIDQDSVVHDFASLTERVTYVLDTFGAPALVEQFIPGREFNIALYEAPKLTVLPPFEYCFLAGNKHGIISYDSKWSCESVDFENTPPNFNPDIAPDLKANMITMARRAYRLLGCRDLARVDFRVTPAGDPYIIEVNPNPDFSPLGGLADCLEQAGLTHHALANLMVDNALARGAVKMAPPVGVEVMSWT